MVARAVGDRIVVRRDGEFSGQTSALVVVEDKPPVEVGTVIAIGPDARDVRRGDRVIYTRYAGRDIWNHQGVDWVVLEPHEALAKVDA